MVDHISKQIRELCSTICRFIWNRRNSFIFAGKFDSPKVLCQKAQCQLLNYQAAQHTAISTTTSASCIQRWQPPPLNAIKLNWDIALNFSSHIAGLGGIVQTESSQVLAPFASKLKMCPIQLSLKLYLSGKQCYVV